MTSDGCKPIPTDMEKSQITYCKRKPILRYKNTLITHMYWNSFARTHPQEVVLLFISIEQYLINTQ